MRNNLHFISIVSPDENTVLRYTGVNYNQGNIVCKNCGSSDFDLRPAMGGNDFFVNLGYCKQCGREIEKRGFYTKFKKEENEAKKCKG